MDTITTIQNLLTSNGSAQPVTVALMPSELRLIAAAPEVVAAAVPVLAELREFIKDSGGCDHSVGICMCEVIRKADELDAALAKVSGHA